MNLILYQEQHLVLLVIKKNQREDQENLQRLRLKMTIVLVFQIQQVCKLLLMQIVKMIILHQVVIIDYIYISN